ncbi:MAG: metallophosphoesterase family protein [Alphaproteobacteria bacterium]|nr:metallophosphoesterase family protein [Alphaproteobacteria bacterium]
MSHRTSTGHALPPGLRIYAIGDIHGRLDLLKALMDKIDADTASTTATVKLIFLGDYIDRGLQSKQVLDYLLQLSDAANDAQKPHFILGNHEQVMREIIKHSDLNLVQNWLTFGGRETLMSYGIRPAALNNAAGIRTMLNDFMAKVPSSHAAFLNAMETSVSYGDYFFCHAGARHGVPLSDQSEQDLVWIRRDFIANTKKYEKMIVHGHTISETPELLPHRINVDTGAYATGCLTAVALEGTQQWLVQTR